MRYTKKNNYTYYNGTAKNISRLWFFRKSKYGK